MPRYHFVVHASDHSHDDPEGSVLSDHHAAAREHGHRVIRELKEGGDHPLGATLRIVDETGQIIHSIPF